MGEFKAVHLQQVEEGISHNIRYAVFCILQTTVKPVSMKKKNPTKRSECVSQIVSEGKLKTESPTSGHSHSETWWRCCCWRHQTARERTEWCLCTGRVPDNSRLCLWKLLKDISRKEDVIIRMLLTLYDLWNDQVVIWFTSSHDADLDQIIESALFLFNKKNVSAFRGLQRHGKCGAVVLKTDILNLTARRDWAIH